MNHIQGEKQKPRKSHFVPSLSTRGDNRFGKTTRVGDEKNTETIRELLAGYAGKPGIDCIIGKSTQ